MSGATHGHASLIGTRLGGYEVVSLIGRGATGTVYLARDVTLKRQVALKVLLGSMAHNPALVKSFHHEAQTAAPLRHPSIVRIYSAGIEAGTPYIAMEYVAGETLDRFLRRKGKVHWTTALYIGQQVAEALDYAHTHGVVHRDVKPANILLDQQGKVHLTDFGIARLNTPDAQKLDSRGFVGTPKYMAPEQVSGREVSYPADLYALGVTLFQMITGELPFEAETPMALIKKITNDEPPRLNKLIPDLPDDVARLVAHLLQKDPDARPPNARLVAQTVDRLQVEKGGRSAIPAALAAFIREYNDAALSPGRGNPRRPGQPGTGRGVGVSSERSIAKATWAVLVGSVALWAIGFALLAWSLWPEPVAGPAEATNFATFEQVAPGVTRAVLPTGSSFAIREIAWMKTRNTLFARATGLPWTLAGTGEGVLTLDPEERQALNLANPVLPAVDNTYWRSSMPMGFAFGGRLLFRAAPWPRGRNPQVALLEQQIDRSRPDTAIWGRFDATLWHPLSGLPWDTGDVGHIIPKADGTKACLLLNDMEAGTNFLIERDVRAESLDTLGPRLTTAESRILPNTVRYSSSGSMIGYMREADDGQRQLWVLWPDKGKTNGTPMAIGSLEAEYCFSPDGGQVLMAAYTDATSLPELRIADIETSNVRVRLGRGHIGPGSWHPSGDYILAVAPLPNDTEGKTQCIWRIDVRDSSLRTPLLEVPGAVASSLTVSGDGRWLAIAAGQDGGSSVVFIDLSVSRTAGTAPGEEPAHG